MAAPVEATAGLAARRALFIQFHTRLPPRCPKFIWPPNLALLAAQDTLDADLFAPADKDSTWRPNGEYERAFLKHLVKRIESAIESCSDTELAALRIERADLCVSEPLLERYVASISQATTDTEGYVEVSLCGARLTSSAVIGTPAPMADYVRYFFPLPAETLTDPVQHPLLGPSDHVVLREEGSPISQGTTGLRTWEASLRLGAHLVHGYNTYFRDGARIVELGSGAGFLSMLCAKALAYRKDARVYATDLEGAVLQRLAETTELNAVDRVEVCPVDWLAVANAAATPDAACLEQADATHVVAADVVYDPALLDALVLTLRAALRGSGASQRLPKDPAVHSWEATLPSALVASTVRNPDTYAAFIDLLEKHGMRWREVNAVQAVWPNTDLPVFPSAHEASRDGQVRLVSIQLRAP